MATTSDLDLATLARVNAGEFLQAFLAGLAEQDGENELSTSDVYEIEELDDTNRVDNIYIELVDSEGGGEGEGEYVHRVWAVKQGREVLSHIRVTGYYQSYYGTEYNDDWTLVAPREVAVTQYFAVDGSDDRK